MSEIRNKLEIKLVGVLFEISSKCRQLEDKSNEQIIDEVRELAEKTLIGLPAGVSPEKSDKEFLVEFCKKVEAFLDNEKILPRWRIVATDATLRFKVDRKKGTVKMKYKRVKPRFRGHTDILAMDEEGEVER